MREEPIILESNQNHATVISDGICPTLPAAMGMGGGYVPMIVMGVDVYNQCITGNLAITVRAAAGSADTTPCVLIGGQK